MSTQRTKKFGRRDLLKTGAAGAGALAASAFLPKKWIKPLVDAGVSPAHAQASLLPGTISGFVASFTEVALPGAQVTVQGYPVLTATSGQDGTYTIANVPVGLYTVNCLPPAHSPAYEPALGSVNNVSVTTGGLTIVDFNFSYAIG